MRQTLKRVTNDPIRQQRGKVLNIVQNVHEKFQIRYAKI